ncbi:MAG TPA: GNAT family N-acetyltransferase [Chthonomonadaceae bacterium]|nr:GNAT family N-acetyltransferase [Chthonomonadaceae bacterium]
MRLVTDRLLLRPFEEGDFEAAYAYRSNEQTARYWIGAPETAEEVRAFLKRCREYALQEPQTRYRFAIVLQAEGRVIGGCGLDITHLEWREGEIGYHLHPAYWGQGYATEAARALVGFGFEHLKLHRIVADCLAENPASARVMQKAGMQQEAHFRQNQWMAGRWQDTLAYAILASEWQRA